MKEDLENVQQNDLQDQHFLLCDDAYFNKKGKNDQHDVLKKGYNNTKIKTRTFLTDIAYICLNKNVRENISFVFNEFTLIAQNLNLFSLDRKFRNLHDHKMVYMLWEECAPDYFINISVKNKTL